MEGERERGGKEGEGSKILFKSQQIATDAESKVANSSTIKCSQLSTEAPTYAVIAGRSFTPKPPSLCQSISIPLPGKGPQLT